MPLPRSLLSVALFVALVGWSTRSAADAPKDATEAKLTTIVDAGGNEVALRQWKIVGGVRKLGWRPSDKTEFFELREFGSTTFKDGALTLVPMSRIQSMKYDYDQETVSVQLAGLEKPLRGTTKFKNINWITIEAEVNQGKSGVADLRYRGGVIKTGFKEVRFPNAKAPESTPAKDEPFSFLLAPEGKGKSGAVMSANRVMALYRFSDGSEQLMPWVMFKKTLKVEIATMQQWHLGDYDVKEKKVECEVQLKDGSQLSLTLLSAVSIEGKAASLVGMIGEVPVGWRLFPIHTFHAFQPGELKIEDFKDQSAKKNAKKKVEPKKSGK